MKYLITLFLLLVGSPVWAFSPAIQAVVSGGGAAAAGSCSTSEIVPTYTVTSTNWTADPSGTILDAINELIADRNSADSAYVTDSYTDYLTLRFTLPGDCNVTAIRAEVFAQASENDCTMNVDISNDNSTWASAQSISMPTQWQETAYPKTFSSLSWTTPQYCYVRFVRTSMAASWEYIISLSITVNP